MALAGLGSLWVQHNYVIFFISDAIVKIITFICKMSCCLPPQCNWAGGELNSAAENKQVNRV